MTPEEILRTFDEDYRSYEDKEEAVDALAGYAQAMFPMYVSILARMTVPGIERLVATINKVRERRGWNREDM